MHSACDPAPQLTPLHASKVGVAHDGVVLLHLDGSIITRDARQHMVLAYRCQSSLEEKKQESSYPYP